MNNQERTKVDERDLNAMLLSFSIEKEIEKLHNEAGWTERDRNAITLQKDDNLRVVLMSLHKGTVLQEHKAEGAITIFVLSGKLIFTAESKDITLEANDLLVLDKPVVHRVEALEETNFLLTIIRSNENTKDVNANE